ncbi:Polar-differentiation response regulator DivK [Pseudobythopirellula maris]|uniref:Polar-differentiation response regulator DivK n=1 Tax=Pseudobythopirellula maris TaxID=2527991 RepID=A0A5C5ZTY4_9BACT|nr:response regulator [Pseudobythopirellula maris]TWT90720.1 Polar-differentiation response regulator DivK [Pseudobythopirellula maris]
MSHQDTTNVDGPDASLPEGECGPTAQGQGAADRPASGQSATGQSETGPSPAPQGDKPKILCLSRGDAESQALNQRFADGVDVDTVSSPLRAIAKLANGDYQGVYADAALMLPSAEAGRIIQNEQILRGMPDGVALLDADNRVLWANGTLCGWTTRDGVVGVNFYQLLGGPEILGPEFCPFHTALATGKPATTTLRCEEGRYFMVSAAPLPNFDGSPAEQLVVTLRDVTDEQQQQQKLAAIHQAGIELADLTPEEVASMGFEERIELLKSNILHYTQDVLQFDVVEIRMLDQNTGVLDPLLAVGIKPEAERRTLRSETSGNGVTGFVAATGKSYLCEDTSEDPLYLEGAQDARSSLTVPLSLHDQVIGTFNVESPSPGRFTESDRQFLEIFSRDVAMALNTLELLAAEKASTAAASVEAIHSAVALPVDDILNDAVNVMERYIGHEPDVVERLQRILRNARDIKQVIQKIGQNLAPVEARPLSARVEQRPLLAGKRLLVADDDDAVRVAAHDLLERYHCVVETAHDGKEAMYMCRNLGPGEAYDAIIADIRLPDMSGYELLLNLKERLNHVPLILMTGFGYDPGHSIVKARQAGLQAVLYKPFRLDQLIETVEQVVGSKVTA